MALVMVDLGFRARVAMARVGDLGVETGGGST